MLVNMSSTNLTINILLEEALNNRTSEPPDGSVACHRCGIAALWTETKALHTAVRGRLERGSQSWS